MYRCLISVGGKNLNPVYPQQPQTPSALHAASTTVRHVHSITNRFSLANTYVIHGEQIVVVDPGTEHSAHLVRKYLHTVLHRSPQSIDLIVLTHLQRDHSGGIETLLRMCHAPVVASALLRSFMQNSAFDAPAVARQSNIADQARYHLDLLPLYRRQLKLVNAWLEDVEGLPGHPAWRVLACPGQTPDHLCLYNPFSLELLSGDVIVTLESGTPILQGNSNQHQIEEITQTLRNLRVHYLYPGHGRPLLSLQPLRNMRIK